MNFDEYKLNILNYKCGNTYSEGTISLYGIKTSGDSSDKFGEKGLPLSPTF